MFLRRSNTSASTEEKADLMKCENTSYKLDKNVSKKKEIEVI